MKIQLSTPERHYHAEVPEGAHWQDALEAFLDGLHALGYHSSTMEEISNDEVVADLTDKIERIKEVLED